MHNQWYPQDRNELNKVLNEYLPQKSELKVKADKIHGLIAPHAGYVFSGKIAGKAFSLLRNKKIDKVVVLGPSHYIGFYGVMILEKIETPLGKVKIIKNRFEGLKKLQYEHSIGNQIPFLQKINSKIQVLPLVVGEISETDAEETAKNLSKISDGNTIFVFSTDLSHFLPYEQAVKKDRETIKIIENLDFKKINQIDACGRFPLLIAMYLCRINGWKPKLIEYKNSGEVIGDKSSVVGYGSWVF